jgi:hypothetical protein
MIGAFAHNAGQLAAVYLLFARNTLVLYQLPVMALASGVAGAVVGLLSAPLTTSPAPSTPAFAARAAAPAPPRTSQGIVCIALLAWSIAVMWVESLAPLAWHAAATTILVQLVARGSLRAFLAPISSFWLLLLMVAAIHLFFTYGRSIPGVPLVTYEGVSESVRQLLRLWTWLQLSQVLKKSGFGAWTMALLGKLLPRRTETLAAGVLALEFFPETLAWARQAAGPAIRALVRSPRTAVHSFAADLHRDLLRKLEESA